MSPAVVLAGAAVLAVAGVLKLRDPGGGVRVLRWQGGVVAARWLAVAELGLALAAIALPVRIGAAVFALVFAGFAAVHLATEDCGCLGAAEAGPQQRSVLLTAVAALALAGVAVYPGASGLTPAAAVLAGGAAAAWLLAFGGGGGVALVDGSAAWLEQRFPRRTLVRVAAAGSALSVAPLRYLLYPGDAEAAILRPQQCTHGRCTDGYTAFCCEINDGVNACPENTFVGGWWMCTDYPGRQLCADQGVRYYVDCNRVPGTHWPGGCQCANGNCNERKVNCNVFRYGQCSPEVHGVTEVVCRQILCQNPSTVPELRCSASMAVDDSTCEHEASCLQPPALQVTPAGGV